MAPLDRNFRGEFSPNEAKNNSNYIA